MKHLFTFLCLLTIVVSRSNHLQAQTNNSSSKLNSPLAQVDGWGDPIETVNKVSPSQSSQRLTTSPSQLVVTSPTQRARLAAVNTQSFNYSGEIVFYTVPTGVYSLTIEARGAEGGDGISFSAGKGALIIGTISATPGQQLKILVGQKPSANGGGGGSFVTDINNNPLVIAGGGAGSGQAENLGNKDGQAGNAGGSGTVNGGTGGTGGNGGNTGTTVFRSGAGGGLNTNGANAFDPGNQPNTGGKSFVNGGAGGVLISGRSQGTGGFGGGGTGSGNGGTSGGGGGYSGGGSGGSNGTGGIGGGGGSFNAGTNPINTTGANSGNGLVIISYPPPCDPFTATLASSGTLTCAQTSVQLTAGGGLTGATYLFSAQAQNTSPTSATATATMAIPYSVTVTNPGGCSSVATTTVMSNTTAPTATLSSSGTLTCTNQRVSFTIGGGPGNFTLQKGTEINSSGSINSPGGSVTFTYDLTSGGLATLTFTTPTNGCTATATTMVMSNTAVPSVSITPSSTAICADQTAMFTASGSPASYSWSSGQTSASISATAQGPYSVTATSTDNGCRNSATANLTVNPLPTPTIVGLSSAYCKDASAVPLSGSPSGGAFTIDNSPATSFNPANLSVGQPIVVYSYTNANGCSNTTSQTVTVNALPTPAITNLAAAYCKDAAAVTLSGTPTGGAFTVDGATATSFNPASLSVGQHTVVYSYTNSSSCSATVSQGVTINALTTPAITNLNSAYCKDAAAVTLTGNPSGGTFTVDGTTATMFTPASLSVGQHTVVYSYTNSSGCSATASQGVTINALPTPTINGLNSAYCQDAGTAPLMGSPTGGAFTIDGATATTFNPASLSVGQHTVVYSYTNSSGCSATASQNVSVNTLPTPSITNLNAAYCKNAAPLTLSGNPTGDAFTVDGTTATTFNPSSLSVGQHTVVYSYTNTNGCSATTSQGVTINALPTPSITGLNSAYCKDATDITLTGAPTGGVFTVDGNMTTTFNPASLSVGQHTVVYSFTNASGCSATSTQSVTVKEVPQTPTITTQSGGSYPAGQSSLTISQNTGNVILGVSGCAGGTITWSGGGNTTLAVSTTNTGTQTFTATCTNNGCTSPLATATVTVVAPTLQVFSRDPDNGQLGNNTIKPYLQLQNVGTTAINYSTITVRYYLTTENNIPLLFQKNYIAIGQNNVQIRYVALPQARQGATGYIEYSFSAGAGSLNPGSDSGPIETQINKQNYSQFNQLDDYSYINNSAYTLNPRITAYQNGVIFYGTEPGPGSPRLAAEEVGTGLTVRVLGNPVTGSQAQVEISGVEGQAVRLELTDLQGRSVHQHRIDQAGVIERVSVPVGGAPGLFLLQVATPTQRQQIKLIKP